MLADADYGGSPAVTGQALTAEQADLIRYWYEIAEHSAGVPPRRAIDPAMFPKALPRVALLEAVPEAAQFRFRIAGEFVIAALGCNPKGLFLEQVLPFDSTALFVRHLRAVQIRQVPVFGQLPLKDPIHRDETLFYTGVTCPFEVAPETGEPQLFLHNMDTSGMITRLSMRAGTL